MAIYGDMEIIETDCLHALDDVAEAGSVLCFKTAGSGFSLGDTSGEVQLAASPSGLKVAGILMHPMVNVDETRYKLNFYKNEAQITEPCEFMKKGWMVTNKVTGSPTLGDKAYLTANGVVTPTKVNDAATPLVGEFGGAKDENGYVKLVVNLPNSHRA